MEISIVLSFLTYFVSSTLATDYCDASLCQSVGGRHIGCGNSGRISDECASYSKLMSFSSSDKQKIVDKHNKLRNLVASGKLPPFQPAVEMATMVWDDELESLAKMNVMTCHFEHDQCRSTKEFPYAGQNLAMKWGSFRPQLSDVLEGVQSWFDEYKYASQDVIDSFHLDNSGKVYGHFTGMMGDNNYKVGCACLVMNKGGGQNQILTCCNYANTNILGQSIYKSGSEPASSCKQKNSQYPALCAVGEKYSFGMGNDDNSGGDDDGYDDDGYNMKNIH